MNNNFKTLKGEIQIPPDKSISHRAIILASLANGLSTIKNFSKAQDPLSTLNIFRLLGVNISIQRNIITINSKGKFKQPSIYQLDCGNSGTTMRLATGILARQNFQTTLIGDEALSLRPMKRIIEPLTQMGAKINSNNFKAPLEIMPSELHAINYTSQIASAQVKSCVLLAALDLDEITTYTEPYLSRNHTELMLKAMGANISINNLSVSIKKSQLQPLDIEICGDISSAAFFMVAALIVPNAKITIKNVGLNPTRTGIIDVIKGMNGNIEIYNEREVCGEVVGDIKAEYTQKLKACTIQGQIIPRLIDEIPIIALLATQAEGQTIIKDAQDLHYKETDRITATTTELNKLGANIKETPDGMIIEGKINLQGGVEVNSFKDHRIAMMLYVAGLITKNSIKINNFEWVKISFPTFEELFESLKTC